jgi:DMSO/TMAO reductase YedYZ molybdopterin-dependent catalytic subunit
MSAADLSRRGLIVAAAGAGLAGCDQLSHAPTVRKVLMSAEGLNQAAQRGLLSGQPLAPEFKPQDISRVFKPNGSFRGFGDAYDQLVETGFSAWRLTIDGLVRHPIALSLDQLKRLPARTQITRHDCVEGWSAIGQWTGVRLAGLLQAASPLPQARFLVFHCLDNLEGGRASGQYYESIDLFDAVHPQTILAYALNGRPLPVQNGAPLRLRVERQLGYKHAKYIHRIEAVASLDRFGGGKGGFWEDRGYNWYAGI